MATLLHDAVMNPAEGNVSWSQGVAVGGQRGRKSGVGLGDRRSSKGTPGPQAE